MRGKHISRPTCPLNTSPRPLLRSRGWILWLCLAPAIVGCRGCSTDDPLTAEAGEQFRLPRRIAERGPRPVRSPGTARRSPFPLADDAAGDPAEGTAATV